MTEAEIAILSYVQRQSFADELHTLASEDSHVKRNSRIRKLDPVLDKNDGLLHVGGRLDRASMPAESKHPIILPKNHHISLLILRQIHHDLKHSGRNHMLAVLRDSCTFSYQKNLFLSAPYVVARAQRWENRRWLVYQKTA